MRDSRLDADLSEILFRYQELFTGKSYQDANQDHDALMDAFSLTPDIKQENPQYWRGELGMCWQLLVSCVFQHTLGDYGAALRIGDEEPCDFTVADFAVDTKYRIGSGDSGTLGKFKSHGMLLRQNGYEPIMLILREDNLPAAVNACRAGNWNVLTAMETFNFIRQNSGFDLRRFLIQIAGGFRVQR